MDRGQEPELHLSDIVYTEERNCKLRSYEYIQIGLQSSLQPTTVDRIKLIFKHSTVNFHSSHSH